MAERILKFIEDQTMEYRTKEAFNSLYTNLQFCGDDVKVVMLTSCGENEGKSTIARRFAEIIAENGERVLLIDADMRKSVMLGQFETSNDTKIYGLSHFLSGQVNVDEIVYHTAIPYFDIIVSGPIPPNPAVLLAGEKLSNFIMAAREIYDYVIIDSTPLGMVIDSAVLAPLTDGAIMVVEAANVSRTLAMDVKKQLEVTGCKILGTILNKVPLSKGSYYYKKYYGKE